MNTLRRPSPIETIHAKGMNAIIDGDNQKIIGEVAPDKIDSKVLELEQKYPDVCQDADGDIVFYRDVD